MEEKKTCGELEKELAREMEKRENAEARLRESEKMLAQIVENNSIPMFIIDEHHRITHWNRAIENLTGHSAEDVIGTGKQWVTFYSEQRPVMADLLVDNASEEIIAGYYGDKCKKSAVVEGAFEAEAFFTDLGEKGRWIFFTAAPLRNTEGKITGAIETLQDVTERRVAEQAVVASGKRYRRLLDLAPYPIAVFTMESVVSYLNPAFTSTFGWTLDELQANMHGFTPPGLEEETREKYGELIRRRYLLRYETKRIAKDGQVRDVVIRAAVYSEPGEPHPEILLILRDITREKRIDRNNKASLKISTALPQYPELGELLDYISGEVKQLLNAEGALVVLLDEEKQELFFPGAAYDDSKTLKRVKESRFALDDLMAGTVIRTGEPVIVNDISKEPKSFPERDKKLGYQTRNFVEVPVRSGDRIIGVIAALNKNEGIFDQIDMEMLDMISGTVALSIENARFSEELIKAYREVSSLNRAKDRVINHLSHELKTPVSIVSGCLDILANKLRKPRNMSWEKTMDRARRNLDRIVDIQEVAADIIRAGGDKAHRLASKMAEQCADLLETVVASECGEKNLIEKVRERIDEIYLVNESASQKILLSEFVRDRMMHLKTLFPHRGIDVIEKLDKTPAVHIPPVPLMKIIDGLVKNAVENTPDEGTVEILVREKSGGTEITVRDWGVGIPEEARRRIFDGFYTTRSTMDYSSKRPFDFNAGGKGADLLRIKIFSDRYAYEINMSSTRCRFLPGEDDVCPGKIGECPNCKTPEDCRQSGGTAFSLLFPARFGNGRSDSAMY